MLQESGMRGVVDSARFRRPVLILLWLALCTGLAVSTFSLVEELCLATACRDTASFTFFGIGMGWLGIAYFSSILLLLWLRTKVYSLHWALTAMVFSGVGAEFRLLWIQKYIIGSWCPLCVSICCALFLSALLLVVEKIQDTGSGHGGEKSLRGWLVFVLAMSAFGLATAILGVRALLG